LEPGEALMSEACEGGRLYLAIICRFFLKVNTTIQQKRVTPVRNPIRDNMVTYSLYESLKAVVPNRMV